MPNHFTVVGLCGRDWESLESGRNDDITALNGANLCELVSPLPDALKGIVASSPPCRYRHKSTGELCDDVNGPPFESRDQWERLELTDADMSALRDKCGAVDWHEWQSTNWGTKCGTYDLKASELSGDGRPVLIEFQCAWGPPNPETMRKIEVYLNETYSLKSFLWIGHDPANGESVVVDVGE